MYLEAQAQAQAQAYEYVMYANMYIYLTYIYKCIHTFKSTFATTFLFSLFSYVYIHVGT